MARLWLEVGGREAYAPAMSAPIATPCVKICAVDGRSGLCVGCGRTLREIGAWTRFSDAERAAIMAALPARRAAAGLSPDSVTAP